VAGDGLVHPVPDVAGTPELAEAAGHVRAVIATTYHERFLDWIARSRFEPEAWQSASIMSDRMLYLTAEELRDLGERIAGLLDAYTGRVPDRTARPEGSRLVTFVELAFPAER
jgi:hypothetical protein